MTKLHNLWIEFEKYLKIKKKFNQHVYVILMKEKLQLKLYKDSSLRFAPFRMTAIHNKKLPQNCGSLIIVFLKY